MTQASTNQQWEESVLSSFLDMVRAPDGDFPTLDRLIRAVSDRDSFELMVELLFGCYCLSIAVSIIEVVQSRKEVKYM